MIKTLNFCRVLCASPTVTVGDPIANARETARIVGDAPPCDVYVFPELSLTGCTCADLFHQDELLRDIPAAIEIIKGIKHPGILFAGAPIAFENALYNCALAFSDGELLGIVPKIFIPNYNEFYEGRWFASGAGVCGSVFGEVLSPDLIFSAGSVKIGVEICEDLWAPDSPSVGLCLGGANLIVNLSGSNDTTAKRAWREDLVRVQSGKCVCAYAYASSGPSESTTDLVYSGHKIIAENGVTLAQSAFDGGRDYIIADADMGRLNSDRLRQNTFGSRGGKYTYIGFALEERDEPPLRDIPRTPFVPRGGEKLSERAEEILSLQAAGLFTRLKNTNAKSAVIGVSGGLDSTLALLVTARAVKKLPGVKITAVTMPGFGTSERTKNNARALIKSVGAELVEIDITEAVRLHLRDIGHDENARDITFENAQARERTQILMDIANRRGGLVVGTGDLSELAMGWCTYNGDQMSMYGVNAGVPKTLVKYLIRACIGTGEGDKDALQDILDTPISPELLPPGADGAIQSTEGVLGSFELNDFFLYHLLRGRCPLEKILALAKIAFHEADVLPALKNFYRRFCAAQFKRSSMPDGVKVGSVCLSPRGDWRMPSDLSVDSVERRLSKLK